MNFKVLTIANQNGYFFHSLNEAIKYYNFLNPNISSDYELSLTRAKHPISNRFCWQVASTSDGVNCTFADLKSAKSWWDDSWDLEI